MTQAPSDLALVLADIALEAGRAILPLFRSGLAVERKGDASPVTEADRRGEAIILARLKTAFAGVPVLAEEAASTGVMPTVGVGPEDRFMLVDPLDGTKEFVGGSGEFTVNIAMIKAGRPVGGVVLAPALGELFVGESGRGAWRASTRGEKPTDWSPISARRGSPDALIAVGSRSHGSPETDAFLARLPVADFVKAGSSLKFCRVAEGAADFYPRFGRTMEWDTAAGQSVLEAAGGVVVEACGGEPLEYGKAARGFDNPHFVAWGDPGRAARYAPIAG